MRTAGTILGIALAAALGACARHGAQTAGAQAPSGEAQANAAAATCPLAQLRGVKATVADIPNGVAITFVGAHADIDTLQHNVKDMAKANDDKGDAFAACPCAEAAIVGAAEVMPGEPIAPGQTSMQGPALPRADSKVDDITTGAILRLIAKNNADAPALRAGVRKEVRALKRVCLNQEATQHQEQP